jgi:uncharacterized protein (TIGR00299 family) protein
MKKVKAVKIAYFDCSFGAAGDMLVAACLDAGASLAHLESELAKLKLPEQSYRLSKSAVNRCSIMACKFDVELLHSERGHEHSPDGHGHSHESHDSHDSHELGIEHHHDEDNSHTHSHSHEHDHSHSHEHDHSHAHDHSHSHEHSHSHDHDHGEVTRSLSEILAMIANADLSLAVKELASTIFRKLGLAESLVHGVSLDQIHFHEVGAVDAIVDIVGFAIAYTSLAIEHAYASAVPLGGGTVKTMHGLFPIPGPAVLNLLKEAGVPTSSFNLQYECLTPTGAAILATVVEGWGSHPAFASVDAIGYGAGTINPPGHPNVVRLILGTGTNSQYEPSPSAQFGQLQMGQPGVSGQNEQKAKYRSEIIAVIETNLDDCSPQILAHAMERLIEEGALDVAVTAQTMKKGRAGHKLSVIAAHEDNLRLQEVVLKETTSLGVRSHFCERIVLERDFQEITVGEGPAIRIKIGRDLNGRIVNYQPEYEDVVNHCRTTHSSLKDVLLQSLSAAATQFAKNDNSEK